MQNTLQNLGKEAVDELSTVYDLLRWGVSQFNASEIYFGHGTDNPWDECFSLISSILNMTPHPNTELMTAKLTRSERQLIVELIVKRIETRLPAAYLTGVAYFCDLPFIVNEDVLVPRSPIGELIKNRFYGLVNKEPEHILDLCTGSGCIAIACAYTFENAQVDALDISEPALEVANENIHQLAVEHRVFPIQSDLFTSVVGQKYDLIVSNPPYVDLEDLSDMPEEFGFEPEIGLGSGEDGLDITKSILRSADQFLTEDGLLIVEVGNSMVHLIEQYPQVPFNWIEFENGGIGVFSLTKQQLEQFKQVF